METINFSNKVLLLNKLNRLVFKFCLIYFLFVSCGDKEKPQTGKIIIDLTDVPGAFSEVNINIQAIELYSVNDKNPVQAKLELKGIINVLKYANGKSAVLATGIVKAGKLRAVKLILGKENSVVVSGNKIPIDFAISDMNIVELPAEQEIKDGLTYHFTIDIDASRSIIYKGGNVYQLQPYIRLRSVLQAGGIKGLVSPANARPYVWACSTSVQDTFATIADSTGFFLIKNLPADYYNLKFIPQNGLSEFSIDSIQVENSEITDAGTILIN